MIVLDTNVASEILRPRPEAGVLAWFDGQLPDQLGLSTVIAAELMYGVARLPVGRASNNLFNPS